MVDTNLVTKLELLFSCEYLSNKDTLSKSDPMVIVSSKKAKESAFREVGRTEMLKNSLHPLFKKRVVVDYYFEEVQAIIVDVWDVDGTTGDVSKWDHLGTASFNLADVVCSLGQCLRLPLKNKKTGHDIGKSKIIIRCEELKASAGTIKFGMSGIKLDKMDTFGKSDPLVEIHRVRVEDNTTAVVYKTEVMKNTLDPVWNDISLDLATLCNNDVDRPLWFKCFDWSSSGKLTLIGECRTCVRQLAESKQNSLVLTRPTDQKTHGTLNIRDVQLGKTSTFIDYIKGGMQVGMMVAIDFTGSNGDPSTPDSLHYRYGSTPNEYVQAISTIGNIVAPYDSNQSFPVFGFGGKVNGSVSHCFPLSTNKDSTEVRGVDGILNAYYAALERVQLSGPTYFQEVIGMADALSSLPFNNNKQNYGILLIITDGVINDMQQTVQAVIEAATKPMSIIIVGVGDADFSQMTALDADGKPLEIGGKKALRDIVQFVPMRDFKKEHISALAKETLAEIPGQVLGYAKLVKVEPRPPLPPLEKLILTDDGQISIDPFAPATSMKALVGSESKSASYETLLAPAPAPAFAFSPSSSSSSSSSRTSVSQPTPPASLVPERKQEDFVAGAQALRKAMKGVGCDEAAVTKTIVSFSNTELQTLISVYRREIQRDLIPDIRSETGGNYREVLIGLLTETDTYDSHLARKAMEGIGTNEKLLTEVVCTRTPAELAAFAKKYEAEYQKPLVDAIKSETSGDYRKTLLACFGAGREGGVNKEKVQKDIQALYEAGEKKLGTDEAVFINLIAGQPRAHVETVALEYGLKYGRHFSQVIGREMSGDLKYALQVLSTPLPTFFADQFHLAMKGVGTDDSKLIRILVTVYGRCLRETTVQYLQSYKRSLKEAFTSETSGDYRKILVAICDKYTAKLY